MVDVLLKAVRNMIKNSHSLRETQFALKDSFSFDDVKLVYEYVLNKEENRLKIKISFRLGDNLYNNIKNTGEIPSKLINKVLEAHFTKKKSLKS